MANASHSQEGMITTAIGIDRDKNSQNAVKWAIDNLNLNRQVILIHVLTQQSLVPNNEAPKEGRAPTQDELQQFFLAYRGFCARKGIRAKEVIINDIDVASALADYISNNGISTMVLGASSRSALTRAFKNLDVPISLSKSVPDFCTVYSVSKTKCQIVKQASRPATPLNRSKPRQPSQIGFSPADTPRSGEISHQGSWSTSSDRSSNDGNSEILSTDRRSDLMPTTKYSGSKLSSPQHLMNNPNLHVRTIPSPSDSFSGSSDFSGTLSFHSPDVSFEHLDYSRVSETSKASLSSIAVGELEDEMRRLKLELKQTMEMYNSACKEAISAKEKVREIDQWKSKEARRIEKSKNAQEDALAMVEMEKQKCKAAIEAAQMAQRLAELESQKRKLAEMKFLKEAEEKKNALDALARCDWRYRKYTIEEIEVATNYFATSEKIGEGGYGPVYKANLDHTAVAIKVLRPDISQGQKQFQREVEVLCRMRHPNMVLLLGACPEYGCLVYEYMEQGSLEDRLFCRNNSRPLPWRTRFRISAEIATALLFLHQTKPEPLVHRDLKPANILLDRNFVSKIADVGLSRLVPPTVADSVTQYHMTAAAGTFCYIDPEYQQTGMLGTKSDIYSFGVMLLQIITSKPAMGLTYHVEDAIENGKFLEVVDTKVTDWPVEETLSFAKLALQCCELRRKDRPDLGSVILPALERLRDLGSNTEAKGGIVDPSTPSSVRSFRDSAIFSQGASSGTSEM